MKQRWLSVLGASALSGGAALDDPAAGPGGQAEKGASRPARRGKRDAGDPIAWHRRIVVGLCLGEKSSRICYLVGRPQKADSAGIARKAPVAMVTHRPSENISNVVSFVAGYPLKTGSDVALEVDDKKFDLFTNDDSAWARTAELDRTIVSALATGRTATVKGTPNSGKPTTDTYSLAGFKKALALIDEACGVSRAETATATQAAPAPPSVAAPAKAASPRKATARKHKASPEDIEEEEINAGAALSFPEAASRPISPACLNVTSRPRPAAISSVWAAPKSPRKWPRSAPRNSAPASCGTGSIIAASPISRR